MGTANIKKRMDVGPGGTLSFPNASDYTTDRTWRLWHVRFFHDHSPALLTVNHQQRPHKCKWCIECFDSFHLIQSQYVGLASYVILIWDHMDTFADEVSYKTVCLKPSHRYPGGADLEWRK